MKKIKNWPALICFALSAILLISSAIGVFLNENYNADAYSAEMSSVAPKATAALSGVGSDASKADWSAIPAAVTAQPTKAAKNSFDFSGTIQNGKVVETTPTLKPTQTAKSSFDFSGTVQDGKIVEAKPTQTAKNSFDFSGTVQNGKTVEAKPTQTTKSSFDFSGTVQDGKIVEAKPTQTAKSSFDFSGKIENGKVVSSEAQPFVEPTATPVSVIQKPTSAPKEPAIQRFLRQQAGTLAMIGFILLLCGLICMCVVPAIQSIRKDKLTTENMSNNTRVLKMFIAAPNKWLLYFVIVLIVAMLIAWSSSSIEWKGLASKGSEVAYGIVHGITHPNTEYILSLGSDKVPYLLLETIAIALLGTIVGGILAIPIAFMAAENVVPKWFAFIVRSLILAIRTIPSIIWALCWIRVTGPGPLCGVFTQSICSIGMISKMYITAIEDLDTRILESLDACGCTTMQKIRYGIIPQLIPNFISTVIYRFDINLKDATTLGIVGAGGIGAALIQAINSRRWSIVGAFLCGLIVLMLIIEYISTKIRGKLANGER